VNSGFELPIRRVLLGHNVAVVDYDCR